MHVLVANAGSSSVKLRALSGDEVVAAADLGAPADPAELERFAATAAEPDAVGHRVVHGGPDMRAPLLVDDAAEERLRALVELAPLHNAPALALLDQLQELFPSLPHVACFDTAFHATIPDAAALYALPRGWIERHAIRRYGFHGLSHEWAAERATAMLGEDELRLVTCHLGSGASLAAIRGGRSVDTTMGFTPNEGLVMASRSGSLGPGLVLWLVNEAGMDPGELEHALEHDSGLAGLAGTRDMREVLRRADAGDAAAQTALDVYLHRLRASIAAMAAAAGGLDALVFTGGVGERSAPIRAGACNGLGWLGVDLDRELNDAAGDGDAELSPPDAPVRVLLVHAREEVVIARAVREVLG